MQILLFGRNSMRHLKPTTQDSFMFFHLQCFPSSLSEHVFRSETKLSAKTRCPVTDTCHFQSRQDDKTWSTLKIKNFFFVFNSSSKIESQTTLLSCLLVNNNSILHVRQCFSKHLCLLNFFLAADDDSLSPPSLSVEITSAL